MKALVVGLILFLSGASFADESVVSRSLCNFEVSTTYWADTKCRVNDVVIGAEIKDGALKLRCGYAYVLCSNKDAGAKIKSQELTALAERWYCTGICYIIGDPEVDPHHKVSAYGPTEAAARGALKCDPDDLSDVVCRQVETNK